MESIHASRGDFDRTIRKAVRARGHFLNETAARKCVYTAFMSLDFTRAGRARWTMRGKARP